MNDNREMLRDALGAIERLQARLERTERAATQPIAIVGYGMRYPGGIETLTDFRKLLENRVNAVRRIPADRWDADEYYSPDRDALGKKDEEGRHLQAMVDKHKREASAAQRAAIFST